MVTAMAMAKVREVRLPVQPRSRDRPCQDHHRRTRTYFPPTRSRTLRHTSSESSLSPFPVLCSRPTESDMDTYARTHGSAGRAYIRSPSTRNDRTVRVSAGSHARRAYGGRSARTSRTRRTDLGSARSMRSTRFIPGIGRTQAGYACSGKRMATESTVPFDRVSSPPPCTPLVSDVHTPAYRKTLVGDDLVTDTKDETRRRPTTALQDIGRADGGCGPCSQAVVIEQGEAGSQTRRCASAASPESQPPSLAGASRAPSTSSEQCVALFACAVDRSFARDGESGNERAGAGRR